MDLQTKRSKVNNILRGLEPDEMDEILEELKSRLEARKNATTK